MDRRAFLSRSALGAGAIALGAPALSSSGCGAVDARAALRSRDAAELLARLERGLARARTGEVERALSSHPRPRLAGGALRLGLEALVVLDVARSVPEGAALPPPLAARLAHELPVLDRYTLTYHTILSAMPSGARRRVTTKVRERPGVTMEVAGWLDEQARDLGVARESRLLLRGHAAEVDVRLRRQSAGAVIDDCVSKVGRVLERSGASVALARGSAASAMMAAIWQQMERAPGAGVQLSAPGAVPAAGVAVPPDVLRMQEDALWEQVTTPDEVLWSARWGRPGDSELETSAILMPLGLVTCGLLLLVGLVMMIVGLAENARWDGQPRGAGGPR